MSTWKEMESSFLVSFREGPGTFPPTPIHVFTIELFPLMQSGQNYEGWKIEKLSISDDPCLWYIFNLCQKIEA